MGPASLPNGTRSECRNGQRIAADRLPSARRKAAVTSFYQHGSGDIRGCSAVLLGILSRNIPMEHR